MGNLNRKQRTLTPKMCGSISGLDGSLISVNMILARSKRCVLFDWGDTLMRDFPDFSGPMVEWPRVEVVKYVPEVLEELSKSWILALATNAINSNEEQIWGALRRVRLNPFLCKVYCFRKIGHKKPSSEFFAYILDDLHLPASRVFMVGDDFESDVLGAVRCGIRAIWFNQHSNEARHAKSYDTVHDMRSLPRALDALRASIGTRGIVHVVR